MKFRSTTLEILFQNDRFQRSFLTFMLALAVVLSIIMAGRVDAVSEVLSDLDCVIEPSLVADVGSAVPGLIETVNYDRSDFVSQGTILAELESGVEKAALELAERIAGSSTAVELRKVNAGFGHRTHQRNQALFQKASISSQTMDQVKTESGLAQLQVKQEQENLELARLDAQRARAALERRIIRSPFEGSIIKRYKNIGEYVEGEPVFEIAQLDPLHVEVIVPLNQLGTIRADMLGKLTLSAPGFDSKELSARVRRIDTVADAASATYGVRLELANPDLTIPAGVRCQVDFYTE
ncbi:MAG: efflux RND transporter periplasmic adaptor subunit [Gammaproteobacteria bacterium]|nr:efflux RND transporter periplasmic adaptor subunit [Gammaproteobacteria bacterium]